MFLCCCAARTEGNSDGLKDCEQAFSHFHKYHIKNLLEDFNAKLKGEDIYKPSVGNESLHENINCSGIRGGHF
jgi:hypothetical protein